MVVSGIFFIILIVNSAFHHYQMKAVMEFDCNKKLKEYNWAASQRVESLNNIIIDLKKKKRGKKK